MKITVTMDLTADNLSKLQALLPEEFDSPAEAVVEPTTKKSTKKEPKPKINVPAPEAEQLTIDEVTAAPETPATEEAPAVTISKTDIRAVALKLSKAGKQKELAEIFAKFGAKKLSDFDSRPADYPALMKELVSANG